MSDNQAVIEVSVRLPAELVERLHNLSQSHNLSEDQIIGQALSMLLNLTETPDSQFDRQAWSALSEESLARIWDNDLDAAYDNWRELYGVQARAAQ